MQEEGIIKHTTTNYHAVILVNLLITNVTHG